MFSQQNQLFVHRWRQQELERQAQQYRLARIARGERVSAVRFYRLYSPVLARLGSEMIMFGSSLQRRYGEGDTVKPILKEV